MESDSVRFLTSVNHPSFRLAKQSRYLVAACTVTAFFLIHLPAHAELWPLRPTSPVDRKDVPFAQRVDPEVDRQMRSMEWRCVGPFVGNRGCGVEMHPTDRNVFYHAHSSDGVWKTEDAGQYWEPITDGQINVGSVGAIAVSRSHPEVIYIGTGEPQLRDCVSWGDGVYKSVDGGKTWKHIGLKNTRNISRVRIHPENPDIVYVAALGNPFGPSDILSQESGLNRMIWDMNYPDVAAVKGKPAPGIIVQAPVGTYRVRLTVDGKSAEQSFELRMNPNESYTAEDSAKRFELWWRLRSIFERSNQEITIAMEMAEKAGPNSEIAKRAMEFSGKLVPQGATLSEIANEPPKMLSKLTTVSSILFHSEGPPPKSCYDVVDQMERQIDAELTAWRQFKSKQSN